MVMYADNAGDPSPVSTAGIAGPRFVSCSHEELVDLQLEALERGGEQALADGAQVLSAMADIFEAARRACDRALADQYTALDEGRFREVFTLAWCAGYRARTRLDETQLSVSPRSGEQKHQRVPPSPSTVGAYGDGAKATKESG
jgi:hypothetical protein